ncbi:MAG: AI-2E family transporter [Betaproteobacteria bacterium]|nr:MAG: AI-2E family transporter [Betaproteobacteria bacterium]TMI04640.1 MAG: AI-2E family transporter [Betaproteobacteria bacterium]
MTPPGPDLDLDVAPELTPADAPRASRRLRTVHYLWLVATAVVIAALLHFLGSILTPFLIGAILAYFGSPLVTWAERHRVPRTVGTLLVILVILLLILALLLVLIPLVQSEIGQLTRRLPELAANLYGHAAPWLRETLGIELQLDLTSVKELIADNLDSAQALTLKLLSGLKAGGTVVLGILINLVMIPVVMFYLLRDWNRIVAHVDGLLPRRWLPRVRIIALEIDGVLAEFLRGQLAVMGVLAVYYVVGLTLAGLQFALPIGILTGLLVFIPYVGFGLGLILGVLAALLQWSGWPGFMAVLTVYGIGQLLENYVLVPFLVGDRIGLHPLAVIFALLAFGELFGFAGVLLALPVSAALLVGLRHLRTTYIDSDLYR